MKIKKTVQYREIEQDTRFGRGPAHTGWKSWEMCDGIGEGVPEEKGDTREVFM